MARFFSICRVFCLVFTLLWINPAAAANTELKSVRVWVAPENTRIVFDLSNETAYKIYTLENPYRIVVDLKQTDNKTKLNPVHMIGGLVKQIRTDQKDGGILRIVLDIQQKAKYHYFLLSPSGSYSHRLVLDVENPGFTEAPTEAEPSEPNQNIKKNNNSNSVERTNPTKNPSQTANKSKRKFIVAIDAGHGGDDPGATGPHGIQEKVVVLQIAKKVADMINAQPGMVAYLTRRGDYYVSLNERVARAERKNAHLFVSIHADAYDSTAVSGSTVYIGGKHTGKLHVADRENSADSQGGVRPGEDGNAQIRNPALRALRIQSAREGSVRLARRLVSEIGSINKMHRRNVQKANFVVLRGSLPSVLIETGYITNHQEEKQLRSNAYQNKLAKRIFAGVFAYAQPQLAANGHGKK